MIPIRQSLEGSVGIGRREARIPVPSGSFPTRWEVNLSYNMVSHRMQKGIIQSRAITYWEKGIKIQSDQGQSFIIGRKGKRNEIA